MSTTSSDGVRYAAGSCREQGGEETELTREIAESDPRLRPRVMVIDECQEPVHAGKYGEAAIDLASKLMINARKYGITLMWLTPEPSTDALPRKLPKPSPATGVFRDR